MQSKRILDIAIGCVALAVTAPVLVGVALTMRVSGDRGPFLHRASRVGENGELFTVLKVRTMVENSGGSKVTVARDPRVTRLGHLLRRYRIDELPQLINVMRGEMSLVGPRPEDPAYVDMSIPLHRRVFTARPGITGLAQLEFHGEAVLLTGPHADQRYRDEILPAKLKLDAEYLERQTTLLDLEILLRTLRTELLG